MISGFAGQRERISIPVFSRSENISSAAGGYHTAQAVYHTPSGVYHSSSAVRRISFKKAVCLLSENILADLSFEFAVAIVNLVDNVNVPKSSYMIDQLARSGTSIGANIREGQYAHSKKDFIAKYEIALKEANETSYWLTLMNKTGRIDQNTYEYMNRLCGNIRRILIASCKTAKETDPSKGDFHAPT